MAHADAEASIAPRGKGRNSVAGRSNAAGPPLGAMPPELIRSGWRSARKPRPVGRTTKAYRAAKQAPARDTALPYWPGPGQAERRHLLRNLAYCRWAKNNSAPVRWRSATYVAAWPPAPALKGRLPAAADAGDVGSILIRHEVAVGAGGTAGHVLAVEIGRPARNGPGSARSEGEAARGTRPVVISGGVGRIFRHWAPMACRGVGWRDGRHQ